jgi:RNA polymerase sigma factor (sigma-70 family)
MSDSTTFWLDSAGRYPLLTKEETIELSRKIQNSTGKIQAKAINKLCTHNLRLVVNVVKKMLSRKARYSMASDLALDLLQVGYFGLRRAAEKFDASRGYQFSTYATPCIRQSVHRYFITRESSIYIPEATAREVYYRAMNSGEASSHKGAPKDPAVIGAANRARFVSSIDVPATKDCDTLVSELLHAEDSVSHSYEGRDSIAFLSQKLDEAGIDEHSKQLMLHYARRGRILIAATHAKYNHSKAGGRIREIKEILQAMA